MQPAEVVYVTLSGPEYKKWNSDTINGNAALLGDYVSFATLTARKLRQKK